MESEATARQAAPCGARCSLRESTSSRIARQQRLDAQSTPCPSSPVRTATAEPEDSHLCYQQNCERVLSRKRRARLSYATVTNVKMERPGAQLPPCVWILQEAWRSKLASVLESWTLAASVSRAVEATKAHGRIKQAVKQAGIRIQERPASAAPMSVIQAVALNCESAIKCQGSIFMFNARSRERHLLNSSRFHHDAVHVRKSSIGRTCHGGKPCVTDPIFLI